MKIVFTSIFKRGSGGGSGRVAHEMARQFAAHHDVVLICPADSSGLYEDAGGLKVFGVQSAGEEEIWMPALSSRTVSRIFDFLDAFSPHVVHAHEPALMGLIGQVWARMNLVPFVHTTHVLPAKALDFGAADALDVRLLRSSLSASVARQVLMDFYENCDAVIALNRPALDGLRQFGYAGRVFVIPNGRDLRRYGSCENASLASPGKVLTFIGYVSERKNQAYLIEALRHLPGDYRLQLIGKPLNPDYGRGLRELCERYGLGNVAFTGQVPHREIPSYLERTHVFVSASKMEVQSLVVIEALASGTPVVGLSNETIDELVDAEVGRWLPSDADPVTFARCVERLCALPQPEYDELCAKARDRVKAFDWANVIAMTAGAYRVLLEERASGAQKDQARLADLVAFLPSGEIREVLVDKVGAWERAIEETGEFRLVSMLPAKVKAVRRVSQSTWLLAGLTILVSFVGYLFMRLVTSISRMRKSEDQGGVS
jgi:glycosyltransferase involved in cell wall biosynthesis